MHPVTLRGQARKARQTAQHVWGNAANPSRLPRTCVFLFRFLFPLCLGTVRVCAGLDFLVPFKPEPVKRL